MGPVFSVAGLAIGAAVGAVAGPLARAAVVQHSVAFDEPWRQKCPACDAPVAGAGWRLLTSYAPPTGRCRACHKRLGPPAASVEVACAAVLGILFGVTGLHPGTVGVAWALLVGVALSFVDVAVHRLPDRLIVAGLAGTLAAFGGTTLAGSASPGRLGIAALSGLGSGLIYFVMAFLSRHGFGLGDAKFALLTGLAAGWYGWAAAVDAYILGLIFAGLFGLALLVTRRASRKDSIPIGPFILLGSLAAIVLLGG